MSSNAQIGPVAEEKSKHWCFALDDANDSEIAEMKTMIKDGVTRDFSNVVYVRTSEKEGEDGSRSLEGWMSFGRETGVRSCQSILKRARFHVPRGSLWKMDYRYAEDGDPTMSAGRLPLRRSKRRVDEKK